MAEVFDIYGKRATGKSGPVSFFISRGKTIMRALPGKRTGQMSEKQLRNQKRFKEIRAFCTPFKDILIPLIWNDLGTTSSGYHLFMKTNSPAFDMDGILQDPLKIKLSMGKLNLPPGMQAQRIAPGSQTIGVKWENEPDANESAQKDRLRVISAGEGEYSEILETKLIRTSLGGTFELPVTPWTASHVYLFFESKDRHHYSESICFEI